MPDNLKYLALMCKIYHKGTSRKEKLITMSFIKCENVSFQYTSDDSKPVNVLQDINLEIEKGQFIALVGRNGCGKSTLAKHFNAILLPDSGKVYVDGMDTGDDNLKYDIRRNVGLVLQNPENQIVATIVEEDVAFGPENLGVPPAEIRRLVDWALKAVDMYDYRTHSPNKLSGGQKQRIAIASVIAMRPQCIVLDEPTAMLDPKGRREVMDTIIRLNKEMGITIILITHYMEEAVNADRVIVMEKGNMIMDGTPEQIFTQVERIQEIGLDVPQCTLLMHRLREKGLSLPGNILDVNACVDALDNMLSAPAGRQGRQ